MKISGNIVDGPVIAPGTIQLVSFTETGNGTSCIQLGIATVNVGDGMDVLAFAPSMSASGGSNMIPAANQNFSGWTAYQGASVTVTQAQTPMIVDSMDYLPFGEQIAGNWGSTHKFTGKERDSETSLDYFGARYYANAIGRFMTPDWAGKATAVPYAVFSDPQSLNLYSYVRNIPTTQLDADGHCPDCVIMAFQVAKWFAKAAQRDGGVKPALKNTGIGVMKGVGSGLLHGAMAPGTPAGLIAPFIKDPPILQPKNQTQVDAKGGTGLVVTAVSLGVGLGVGSGPGATEGLAGDAMVVRGGVPTVKQLTNGAESINANGTLQGVSVQSANGASVEQLSQGLKNNQVGVTTVGDVGAAGGDVIQTPQPNNPCHCDMNGVSAQDASKLFQVQPNPSKTTTPQ